MSPSNTCSALRMRVSVLALACCAGLARGGLVAFEAAANVLHLRDTLETPQTLALRVKDNELPSNKGETGISLVPCKPRETLVSLPATPPQESVFMPDVALVRRCGGYCGTSVACVADKVKLVKRKVREYNLFNPRESRTRTFRLEQHESCKCGCKVQASQCMPEQRFEPQRCRCVCRSAAPPTCRPPHTWHADTCRCGCPAGTPGDCSSGTVLSRKSCRCTAKRKKKGA